ncbi:MAG: PDZ domain-containing protein [Evtepia gabavorous]
MSRTKIQSVAPGTPAHQAGVRPGETLLAINGHPIVDVLDYKYYAYDPELVLQLRSEAGERTVELSKDVGEDLGLTFATYLMDRARSCANKCVFCFVDQMPQGMRDTFILLMTMPGRPFWAHHPPTPAGSSSDSTHISPINIPSTPDRRSAARCWATSAGRERQQLVARAIVMNCRSPVPASTMAACSSGVWRTWRPSTPR